jgi:hypothetical protein
MCSFNFVLLFIAGSRELAYLFQNVKDTGHAGFDTTIAVLTYLSRNPLLFFFLFISLFTGFALFAFYVVIMLKYAHGFTFNEEDKVSKTVTGFLKRLEEIQKKAKDAPDTSPAMVAELRRIGEWTRKYRENYRSGSRLARWFRLMWL